MSNTETYRNWLGDAYDDLNEGVIEKFTDAAGAYEEQEHVIHRDPEDKTAYYDEDDSALSAILQSLLHEDSLAAVASRASKARDELRAWVRAQAALGVPESAIAEQSRLSRTTVRSWLGK